MFLTIALFLWTATAASDHHAASAENQPAGRERRNRARFHQRNVRLPEARRMTLLTGAIKVRQICQIARRVLGEPSVRVENSRLVQQPETVAGSLAFVVEKAWQKSFVHRRLSVLTDFERVGIDVPLHSVSEQVGQQKEALFGSDGEIDVDFRTVEIADERIGDIARDHRYMVVILNAFLDAGA